MKKPTPPYNIALPASIPTRRHRRRRRRSHARTSHPAARQLLRTGVMNVGFLLLAFRPLPERLLTATLPPQPVSIPAEAPQAPLAADQHSTASLNRLLRLQKDTETQIQLERRPPTIHHTVPDAFLGETVNQVELPAGDRAIALTFDDGPSEYTGPILDILQKHDIRATFFVLGQTIPGREAILQRIVDEGHILGNHTWSHPYYYHNPFAASGEIDRSDTVIHDNTRVRTRLFRPPGGFLNNGLAAYAAQENYSVVMWSVDSFDYFSSTAGIVANVVGGAHPGAIVLFHDGGGNRANTVAALPQLIQQLQQQGYDFVTLPELMERSTPPALQKASESATEPPQTFRLP